MISFADRIFVILKAVSQQSGGVASDTTHEFRCHYWTGCCPGCNLLDWLFGR